MRNRDGKLRNKTIRRVNGIGQVRKINKQLWDLTEQVAKLAA